MINPGDRGDVVTVVTNTLHRLGFLPAVTDVFTKEVEIALRAFQQERGLTISGIANEITLGALEEARWKLGDRTLFFNNGEGQLLMRGDDVATLQNRLIDMGFDAGRVDGIYGLRLANAVKEFQKSSGVMVDGVCGPVTVIALMRLSRTVTGGAPTTLRYDAVRVKRGPALADKIVVLDLGSATSDAEELKITSDIARRIEGRLIALGVSVLLTSAPSRSEREAVLEEERISFANNANPDLVISLHVEEYPNNKAHGVATYFYGSDHHGVHSIVGERFATLAQREICARTDLQNCRTHAKTWNILRLTKAPTVCIALGYITNPHDASRLADSGFRDAVAEALVIAIQRLYLSAENDAKTGSLKIEDLRRAGIRR